MSLGKIQILDGLVSTHPLQLTILDRLTHCFKFLKSGWDSLMIIFTFNKNILTVQSNMSLILNVSGEQN
jgi:hypothetical protein